MIGSGGEYIKDGLWLGMAATSSESVEYDGETYSKLPESLFEKDADGSWSKISGNQGKAVLFSDVYAKKERILTALNKANDQRY